MTSSPSIGEDDDVPIALLDLDGTLTDPKVGITRSVQFALHRIGAGTVDLDRLTDYIGPPLRDSFRHLAGLTPPEVAIAVAAYREYFSETGIFENSVYDGIPAILERLRLNGWRLALATSKPTVFAERILERFSLRDAFEVVAGASLDETRDRKEQVIEHAFELLGAEPGRGCVMVGDRSYDIAGARHVGIAAIGVTWGYGSADELRNAGADRLVDAVDELPDAMDEMDARAG